MFSLRFRVIHQSATPRADVLWINHAGGTTNALLNRVRSIQRDPFIRMWTPYMPAREELTDAQFDGDLEAMASMIVGRLVSERSDQAPPRPLVLVGHSFGSVIAYRIACLLSSQATDVHRLVVLSFPSPEDLSHEKQLSALDDQQLIAQVDKQFGGLPQDMLEDEEARKLFVPALRFDIGLLAGYEHRSDGQSLPIPITAICGTDDHSVDLADMHGWSKMTDRQFRLRAMPGDHFFALERMAEVLEAGLWDVLPG